MPKTKEVLKLDIGEEEPREFEIRKFRTQDIDEADYLYRSLMATISENYMDLPKNPEELGKIMVERLPAIMQANKEFVKHVLPIGLWVDPSEVANVPIVEAIPAVIKIIEVNADFFGSYMSAPQRVTEKLLSVLPKETST